MTFKFDRAKVLIKQGMMIFPQMKTQFQFNEGVMLLTQREFKKAMLKYYHLYREHGKMIRLRPPAKRLEGCNKEELQKFAILQNLIIAFMLCLREKYSKKVMNKLYQILVDENLLHVRFT